jgi:hypothetical protein
MCTAVYKNEGRKERKNPECKGGEGPWRDGQISIHTMMLLPHTARRRRRRTSSW